jgi:hypothetical protein
MIGIDPAAVMIRKCLSQISSGAALGFHEEPAYSQTQRRLA